MSECETTNNLIVMPKYKTLKKLTQSDSLLIHKTSKTFARAWQQFHKLSKDLIKKIGTDKTDQIQSHMISGTVTAEIITAILKGENK